MLPRWVLYTMIPVNLAVMAWMLMGRALFDVELGWRFLFVLVFVLPVLAVCFTISTALALRRKRLTPRQAWAQVTCWAALVVVGAAIIDYNDADLGEPRESVLTEVFGASVYASRYVMYLAFAAAAASWVVLTTLLMRGRAAVR